ncbi:WD-40 repeat-containing protein MSI4 [Capsicum chinense]|nr:WD-40 repeat-containing protein MSI4 [Capsicum chinense]
MNGRTDKGGGGEEEEALQSVEERYTEWKSLIPVLYDWLANHNLVWPSLSCRLANILVRLLVKSLDLSRISVCSVFALNSIVNVVVFVITSLQTDGSCPNTLVIANCEIVKPRVAAALHISQFNEESRSPFVKMFKTIIHPGEVPTLPSPHFSFLL